MKSTPAFTNPAMNTRNAMTALSSYMVSTLVSGQALINFGRPSVDSSGHVLNLCEALLPEPLSDLQAAAAEVAVHNDPLVSVRLQFVNAGRDFAHRYQGGSLDVDQLMLVRFATI